jgi:hypothetical protein
MSWQHTSLFASVWYAVEEGTFLHRVPHIANRLVCCHDIDHVTKDEHLHYNCSFSKAQNSSCVNRNMSERPSEF